MGRDGRTGESKTEKFESSHRARAIARKPNSNDTELTSGFTKYEYKYFWADLGRDTSDAVVSERAGGFSLPAEQNIKFLVCERSRSPSKAKRREGAGHRIS